MSYVGRGRSPLQRRVVFNLDSLEARVTPTGFALGTIVTPTVEPQSQLWHRLDAIPVGPCGRQSYLGLDRFLPYSLDAKVLDATLAATRPESAGGSASSPVVLALPQPDGSLAHFRVVTAPIMEPGLAAQFPEIRTYRGQGIEDPAATLSMDVTPQGLHAQVLSPNGTWYIDPYWHLDTSVYASYWRSDRGSRDPFFCFVDGDAADPTADAAAKGDPEGTRGLLTAARSGSVLRTYRTAVAATGEYTTFQGGTVTLGQAAIVTAINRVSGIMEVELSIRLTLVANNSSLVYTNASSDPYSNNNASSLLTQNQSTIDSIIGSGNYDIGHVFGTGGGGLATLGVVGRSGSKAQGETGSSSPIGDWFYIDYVIHEMGHQFGADHTFNGVNGSAAGNRAANSAYEPGSGSTIMSYAGICGADDLQAHSDPYYHSRSFDQIIAYVDNTIPSVGTRTATGNTVPTVNGGADYAIPTGTPFALTAAGSDADGDTLTYQWEQRNLGAAQALSAADNGASPLFRSFTATSSPTRTFPRLTNLLANVSSTSEKLPTLARTMNFRVTVRDNRAGGGGVNTDDVVVTVVNTGGAFQVTAPNTSVTWTAGSTQSVTWNVAGTTTSPINVNFVNIRLSTDGGNTFPIVLVANTPNDGSESLVVPNSVTSLARIKVEPVGNIFFDVSNANFTIAAAPPRVASAVANPGVFQRSRVTSVTVTFDSAVAFANPNNIAAAFQLSRIGGGSVGSFTASASLVSGVTVVTLTNFAGTEAVGGSLANGRFTLTILSGQVLANGFLLDGDGNGLGGDDYVLNGTAANGLFRYFGDIDGDGDVDGTDLFVFAPTVFSPDNFNPNLDFDGDGDVDGTDLFEFVQNLFVPLP
ncbi:MAG: M12 family metallo-peptidase [Gemmataceae bacterium]